MGHLWQDAITQQVIPKSNAFACVADAPHPLADVLDGAQQIVTDIVQYCH
jgi:hypothetical protein